MHFPILSLKQHEILHAHFLYFFPSLLMLPCNLELISQPVFRFAWCCTASHPVCFLFYFPLTIPSSSPSLLCTTLNNSSPFFVFSPSKNALILITVAFNWPVIFCISFSLFIFLHKTKPRQLANCSIAPPAQVPVEHYIGNKVMVKGLQEKKIGIYLFVCLFKHTHT